MAASGRELACIQEAYERHNTKSPHWAADASGASTRIFRDLKGVEKVESGYAGGKTKNPSYRDVCSGTTGHAEVVQVTFDPTVISFRDLLGVFFTIHDPTTLNRQGADIGTQYRSVGVLPLATNSARRRSRRSPS